jgi:menaquinone-dependent protoporphyrinogen oxidase
MRVLVAVASRSGATAEIAERIAARLRAAGHQADAQRVADHPDVSAYEAVVVGSAVYIGRWEKAAVEFVQRNGRLLAERPTWLFSSGPLGADPLMNGVDKLEGAVTAEVVASLTEVAKPREHRVFYGALDPRRLGVGPRLMRMLPAGRRLLEEGDFRNWADIESWADRIAGELAGSRPMAVTAG